VKVSFISQASLAAGLLSLAALAGCGNSTTSPSISSAPSSSGSSSTAVPASSSAAAAISTASCPSAGMVGGALDTTLETPTVVTPAASATPLPSGASGIACLYEGTSGAVVVIALASGLPSSYLTQAEQQQMAEEEASGVSINFTPISGLGDEAASYQYTADGRTVEGVLAGQGGNFAGVFTDGATASLSQCESLVSSLL
jgi:hypothetical protein